MLRIVSGDFSASLVPEIGGGLARFCQGETDLMRHGDVAAKNPLSLAAFPMVPWCNRIRNGRFGFEGCEVALPGNHENSSHSLHGHGWHAAWRIADQATDRVTLAYDHVRDAWPWAYEARLIYAVRGGAGAGGA